MLPLRRGQHWGTIPYPPSVNLAGHQMRCSLDPIPLADHHEPPDSKRPGVTSCAHRRMSLGVPASLGTRNHAEDDPGRSRSPQGTAWLQGQRTSASRKRPSLGREEIDIHRFMQVHVQPSFLPGSNDAFESSPVIPEQDPSWAREADDVLQLHRGYQWGTRPYPQRINPRTTR